MGFFVNGEFMQQHSYFILCDANSFSHWILAMTQHKLYALCAYAMMNSAGVVLSYFTEIHEK